VTTAPETARPDDTGTTAAATQEGLRAAAPKEYDAPEQAKIGTLPPDVGLAVGSTAPDFELPDSQGRPVKLSQLATDHNVLLVFYRGGWWPYCNFQVRKFSTRFDELDKRRIRPVFVSVDEVDGALVTEQAYHVPFPLLSDPDLKAHHAFRVAEEVSPEGVKQLAKVGISLERWSQRKHRQIAIPSIFLLDSQRKVVWAHADRNHRRRPKLNQILAAIDSVKQ
jgi:peroxiredoxin